MPYDPLQLQTDIDAITSAPSWADETKRNDFIRQVGIQAKANLDTEAHNQLMSALWGKAQPSTLKKAAGLVGRGVEEMAKSVPAAGGAAVFAATDALGITDTGSGTRLMQGGKNLIDTIGQRVKQFDPNDRQELRDGLLESLKTDLDAGAVPQGFEKWLSGEYDNQDIDDPDTKAFVDALVSGVSRAGIAADRMGDIDSERLRAFMESDRNPARADSDVTGEPGARQFLADYVATKDPASWEAFKNRVTETDQQYESRVRKAVAGKSEASGALAKAPEGLAKEMIERSFSMQESPIDLASVALPFLRGAKALQAARAGGTAASTLKTIGTGMAKEAGQEAGTEYLQDPRATTAQIAEAGALGAIGSGTVEGGMAAVGALTRPRDPSVPATPEEEAIAQTVEGARPTPIEEDPRLADAASAVEQAVAPQPTVETPSQEAQPDLIDQIEETLDTKVAEVAQTNADVLPMTAEILKEEAPAPVEKPFPTEQRSRLTAARDAQQPAPQRDTSKPEQMTPEELPDAEAFTVEQIQQSAAFEEDSEGQRLVGYGLRPEGMKVGLPPIQREQGSLISASFRKQKPVSKAAVDAYGITLPEGYVAEGELYVYRPEGGKVEEAPAPTKPRTPKKARYSDEYMKGVEPIIRQMFDWSDASKVITKAAGRKLSEDEQIAVVKEWTQRLKESGELVVVTDFAGLSMEQAYMLEPVLETLGLTKPKVTEAEAPPPPAQKAEAPPPPPEVPKEPSAKTVEGETTRLANETMNLEREQRGEKPLEAPLLGSISDEEMLRRGSELMAQDPRRGSILVSSLIESPRNLNDDEIALFTIEKIERRKALRKAVDALKKATPETEDAAQADLNAARQALNEHDLANSLIGSIAGRTFRFRQVQLAQDFSFENLLLRLEASKGKREVTKEELLKLEQTSKEIEELTAKAEEIEAKSAIDGDVLRIMSEEIQEALVESRNITKKILAESKAAAKSGRSMVDFLREKREEAKKRIKSRGITFNIGLNPAELTDLAWIMASYIAEGIVSVADLTTKMVKDFGEAIRQHIPQIKAAADKLAEAEEQVFTSDEAAAKPSAKELLAESNGEDFSERWVYNRVKEMLVEMGEPGLKRPAKEVIDEVFTKLTKEVNEFLPEVTENDLRVMFSGYGKIVKPSQEDVPKRMRQLRRLTQLYKKLEDAAAEKAPLRSGPQRDEATAEEREALKKLHQVMKDMKVDYAPTDRAIKSPLDAVKSRVRNQIEDLDRQIAAIKAGKPLETVERKDVGTDDELKALVKRRDALKADLEALTPEVEPTAQERVEARLKDLDKQIATLKEKLNTKDFQPAQNKTPITEQIQVKQDQRDALSQALKEMRLAAEGPVVLTQEQINELAEKNLTRQIKAVERQIKEANFEEKAGLTPEPSPLLYRLQSKLEALRSELADLKKAKGVTKKQKTDAELIDIAVASAEKSIDELSRRIEEGDLAVKRRDSRTPEVAKVKNLRAERDSLRKELQRLRKAKEDSLKDPVREQIKRDRKYLERMIKDYEGRLARGDFKPKTKKAKEYDQSLIDTLMKLDELKYEVAKKNFEEELKSRGKLAKGVDIAQQTLATGKAFLTSGDFGGIMRQGNRLVFSHPVIAARNILGMLKAFKSGEYYKREMKELKDRDNYRNGVYKQAGLFLADTDTPMLSQMEDEFMTRFLNKVTVNSTDPVWKQFVTKARNVVTALPRASQRSHVMFLNKMRADVFDTLAGNLKPGEKLTKREAESLGTLINNFSGRGDLGKGKVANAANFLASVFFSPRMLVANFQALMLQPLWKSDPAVRKLIAQEYARVLGSATLLYALVWAAQDDDEPAVELDPRSSDFLKIRFGDTRLDPLGGIIQASVFLSRLVTGETKKGDRIDPLRDEYRLANLWREVPRTDKVKFGKQDMVDAIVRFGRSKASPNAAALVDLVSGKNIIGKPVTPEEIALRSFTPISANDVVQALEAKGFPEGLIFAALALAGVGTLHYNMQANPEGEEMISVEKLEEIVNTLFK